MGQFLAGGGGITGFAAGEIPKLPLNLPLIKGASIVGVFWGAFTAHEPKVHQDNMRAHAMISAIPAELVRCER